MSFNDAIGLGIIAFIIICALFGLYVLTKPSSLTQEEYEKRLRESSGIAAGSMNALMNPIQELINPKAVEAVHVIKEMREGHYESEQEAGESNN